MNLNGVQENIMEILKKKFAVTEVPHDSYSEGKYPKLLPIMRFHIRRYEVKDLGHLFVMHTESKIGMELVTVSLVPGSGKNVPYMLVDMMSMKNKDTVMVEYYDCTDGKTKTSAFEAVQEKYRTVSDYHEDGAWYVKERTPYALIKRGNGNDMIRMVYDSFEAYASTAEKADSDAGNAKRLETFRERMIELGNPASEITEKLFGKEGAKEFFRSCVFKI